MATRIRLRRGTAATATASNPTLADGEPGYETDTGNLKIGDGTTAWNDLPYHSLGIDRRLAGWAAAGAYQLATITYDGTWTDVIASATVVWPDGSAGALTMTDRNTTAAAYDGYTITHTDSGLTVTQPAVTRDGNGQPTTIPAITVT